MQKAIATTGRKWSSAAERLAREAAARLGIPYVERGRQNLPELRADAIVESYSHRNGKKYF